MDLALGFFQFNVVQFVITRKSVILYGKARLIWNSLFMTVADNISPTRVCLPVERLNYIYTRIYKNRSNICIHIPLIQCFSTLCSSSACILCGLIDIRCQLCCIHCGCGWLYIGYCLSNSVRWTWITAELGFLFFGRHGPVRIKRGKCSSQ